MAAVATVPSEVHNGESVSLDLDRIEAQPHFNPRLFFHPDEHTDLIESIKEVGIVCPITVRPHGEVEGRYWIVAGERRWRAAKAAGLTRIPAVVRYLDDQPALAVANAENKDRANISPAEEARTAQRMMVLTHSDRDECARLLGWSARKLDARLLLTQACEDVILALAQRRIKLGHAELLSCLPEETQRGTLSEILSRDLPVEELRVKLDAFALDLGTAIFDKSGCAGCPNNTTRQASLFDQNVGQGRCTKLPCFHQKTVAHLHEQRVALRDEHNAVYLDTERARGTWTIVLKRDVGTHQFNEGCKQCANFGCLIVSKPGEAGRVQNDVCFDLSCHTTKVQVERENHAQQESDALVSSAQASPENGESKPVTRATSGTNRSAKQKALANTTPRRVLELVHGVHRRVAGAEVVRNPKMAQVYAVLSLLKELGIVETSRDAQDPLSKRGIRRANRPDPRTALIAPLYALDAQSLRDITTELGSMVAGREMGDTETEPKYLRGAQATLSVLAAPLHEYFTITDDFLAAHTKSGMESVLRAAGFHDFYNTKQNDPAGFKKLLTRNHAEIIKEVMSSGFAFAGYVPSVVCVPS